MFQNFNPFKSIKKNGNPKKKGNKNNGSWFLHSPKPRHFTELMGQAAGMELCWCTWHRASDTHIHTPKQVVDVLILSCAAAPWPNMSFAPSLPLDSDLHHSSWTSGWWLTSTLGITFPGLFQLDLQEGRLSVIPTSLKWKTWVLHPGRLTWNIQITHLERKMIFRTSMRTCSSRSSSGV